MTEPVLRKKRQWKHRERSEEHKAYKRVHSLRYYHENKDEINKIRKEDRMRNPEKTLNNKLKYKYGITLQEYENMLASQNGVCAICGKPPKAEKRLHVDHAHVEGYRDLSWQERKKYVRGLLCDNCNLALGNLGESKQTVMGMIRYIERCCVA